VPGGAQFLLQPLAIDLLQFFIFDQPIGFELSGVIALVYCATRSIVLTKLLPKARGNSAPLNHVCAE
jgi:hypothetical protein